MREWIGTRILILIFKTLPKIDKLVFVSNFVRFSEEIGFF